MKILIITTRFYPHIGGVEEVVLNIARNLSKDNDVRVLSSLDSETGLSVIEKITKVSLPEKDFEGFKNKRIWINLPNSILGYIIFPARFFLALAELISYVTNFKPDVINYHFPDDSVVYADLLASVVKTPLVVNIHGNDLHKYSTKPFHRFFINRILRRAQRIVVNSSYMKSEVLKSHHNFKNKVKIIPNGLNIDAINGISAKPFFETPYIFYIGRIVEKKGVDLLIRSFYKLGDNSLRLVVEGKGEELAKVKAIASGLNLDPKVVFTDGKLSNDEKIEIMKGAIFGVVPSRVEPFGIVALEFMAAGTPFIASKTGGLKDLLEDNKTCLFFENGNIDDLTAKMEIMLSNPALRERLSEHGKLEAQNYGWDVVSEKYYNTYKEAI